MLMDLDLMFWISISTLGINGSSAQYPARQKGEIRILRTTVDCKRNEILGPGHVDFSTYVRTYIQTGVVLRAYGSRFDVLD
jgi:hypothetical protein